MANKFTPARPAKSAPNRVWIELEQPRDDEHAKQICEAANRMMRVLIPGCESEFMFFEHKRMYGYGDNMGFKYLVDRGEWFNLDFLGRDRAGDKNES